MQINELGQKSHDNAVAKGFYDDIRSLLNNPHLSQQDKDFIRYLWRASRLMLITSELAEGLEGLRHGNLSSEPKSGGLGEELADAQIRLADFAEDEWIDLELAVEMKAAYNATRERKHGKVA